MTAATSSYDPYGNIFYDPTYPLTINAPVMITTANTNINWPNLNITAGTAVPANWIGTQQVYYNHPYLNLDPNQATMTPEVLESLFEKMITVVKPGEKFVLCFDGNVTAQQCSEVQEVLKDRELEGIVISSARAGVGFRGNPQGFTQEEERVDILARIGELWALCPELKLTSLLEWWHGEEMDDKDFAAAVEVYHQKVTNGVRGKP